MFRASLSIIALSSFSGALSALLSDSKQFPAREYDFVVVGGGTAGCVVANRLSEDPSVTVLVIEAGGSNTQPGSEVIQIPFEAGNATPGTVFDWNYTTVPQPGLGGRSITYPRGHVLGGSSSVNFMDYTRGPSDNFDHLAEVSGDEGWSWNNILPFILKSEKHVAPADLHNTTGQFDPKFHGFNGNLLTSLPGFPSGSDSRVIKTTVVLKDEFPFNIDMNSGNPLGIGWVQSTIGHGARSSSATAFLAPALNRHNVDILIQTQVTKLIHEETSGSLPIFRGVEFLHSQSGSVSIVTARREIILSAGTIGTPQILMLSGIGNSQTLKSLGIKPIVDSPDVGENMQDHAFITLQWTVNSTNTLDALNEQPSLFNASLSQYEETHTGQLADGHANQIGWFRLPQDSPVLRKFGDPTTGLRSPHFEFLFENGFFSFTPQQVRPSTGNFFTILVAMVSPTSKGSVKLATSSVFDHPLIDPALLASEFDQDVMVEAVRTSQRFVAASPWKDYIIAPFIDSLNTTDSDAIKEYAMRSATTLRHPVGTSKISKTTDKHGVVGPQLLVKNLIGVRVVDASIIPFAFGAHPQAAVYAIAERAANLIKVAHGLKF